MITGAPDIFIPKRNPLWYPGNRLRDARGRALPYTLDDVAGRVLSPAEQNALHKELSKFGRDAKLGVGAKAGRGTTAAPFTPLDIAGCMAWFDVMDSASYTDVAGVASAITNKASLVSWTQGTAANRPAIQATGFNALYPCFSCDGTNDSFISNEAAVYGALANSVAYTLIYVAKLNVVDRADSVFGVGNTGVSTAAMRYWGQTNLLTGRWISQAVNDATTVLNATNSVVTDLNHHLFRWTASASTVSLSVDRAAADPSGAAQNPGTLTPNQAALFCRPDLGPDSFLNGLFAELQLYNSELVGGNITDLESYAARWGV